MNIMMSDSLSNRVKKETIERQIEESSFENKPLTKVLISFINTISVLIEVAKCNTTVINILSLPELCS